NNDGATLAACGKKADEQARSGEAMTEAKKVQGLSNIQIAQNATLRPIQEIATDRLGIPDEALHLYGRWKAKVSLDYIDTLKDKPDGKPILVTAISPTPAGEGKTTTT